MAALMSVIPLARLLQAHAFALTTTNFNWGIQSNKRMDIAIEHQSLWQLGHGSITGKNFREACQDFSNLTIWMQRFPTLKDTYRTIKKDMQTETYVK